MTPARILKAAFVALSISGMVALVGLQLPSTGAHAQDHDWDNARSEASEIVIGWQIAPKFINARGKDLAT